MREWLNNAVFYEIYPQSFRDSDGDGIGDIRGIEQKLDYIQETGCNAIWMNPCFDSPFVDAGYDVRDYCLVAPRYGTNEDLKHLFDELHRRGMHILLDLVPGHTSIDCAWFRESAKAARNEYTDRYIWTDRVWDSFDGIGSIVGCIRGGTERNGACAANFFNAQPALNYGFAEPDPAKPWQQRTDAPGPMATREAIKNVMRYWLALGCDGFRVDMAGSLVKSDPEQKETIALWQDFRQFLEKEYPEAVMVSEWGQPDRSLLAGFHMDFLLHFGPSHYLDLFRVEHPYFSREGRGDCRQFFDLYLRNKELTKGKGGLICIPSGNHDMIRMARTLDPEEIKLAFAFLFSMPGVPFVYYGDELGMHYVEGLTSVEGGYERTGSRSPMVWNKEKNAGFSDADEKDLYIPQDASRKEINAASEEADPDSVLREVQALTALRKAHPALGNRGEFRLMECGDHAYPLAYERIETDPEGKVTENGERILVILNPADREAAVEPAVTEEIPDCAEVIRACGTLKPAGGKTYAAAGDLPRKDGKIIMPGASAVFLKLQ